jgi:hypothetical protein
MDANTESLLTEKPIPRHDGASRTGNLILRLVCFYARPLASIRG